MVRSTFSPAIDSIGTFLNFLILEGTDCSAEAIQLSIDEVKPEKDLRVLKYQFSIRTGEGCQGLKGESKAWPKLYAGQEPSG